MSIIKGIRSCYVPTSDVTAMRQFYEETLELVPRYVDGEHWVQYAMKGAHFSIAGPREAPSASAGHVVVFEVTDMDGLIARLEATGQTPHVQDLGPRGRLMSVYDPMGQPVQFFAKAPAQA